MVADDTETAFNAYKETGTPDSMYGVVTTLRPTIDYALSTVGGLGDPTLKARARLMAAEAVQTYDPSYGASLKTHVAGNLRRLGRVARKHKSPIQLPERTQLDMFAVNRAEAEYVDKRGQDPDLTELADITGLSMKRIQKVRESVMATPTEASEVPSGETMDYHRDAQEYVYMEVDKNDRKIMEWKLGFGGSKPLTGKEIAGRLRMDPAQVSRRSARLVMKISEIQEALETT